MHRTPATVAVAALAAVFTLTPAPAFGQTLNMTQVGHWDEFGGSYADIWGDGDYAYMGHFGSASVDIIDISDPTSPFRVSAYQLPPVDAGASAQDVKVAEDLMFIGMEGGSSNAVHIVDVRDPTNPVWLVDISIPGFNGIHNVFYDLGYLYLADSNNPTVVVIDLTTFDPDNPPSTITSAKWVLSNVGSVFVHDITVVDGRLYCSAWDSGIWIYDITNIASSPPQFLGSGPGNNTHSAWPTDDGQYVICGEERTGGGILVYRIVETGPSSIELQITDTVTFPTSAASSVHNQAVIGNRVYNSWYGKGVQVYDVDPISGTLTHAAAFDTPITPNTWGIYPFLGTDRILASDIATGLTIIELTDPPINDACENAIAVGNGVVQFDTTNANSQGIGSVLCGGEGNAPISSDIWYTYFADCDGPVDVSSCGTSFDTKIAVYSLFCPGASTESIACSDDGCGLQSALTFDASAGTNYFIRIGGIGGAEGPGMLTVSGPVSCIDPPVNDDCGSATLAVVGDVSIDTAGATTNGFDEAACTPIQNDVWYRLLAERCDTTFTVSLCDADFDATIAIYGSSCPEGEDEAISCSDNGCASGPSVTFDNTGFELFRIRIGSASGTTGQGTLSITCDELVDCNENGIADPEDLNSGASLDCNENGVPDECDITTGTSDDTNTDGIPDECTPPCPADTDGDDDVDVDDLVAVILDWQTDGSEHNTDFDDSGVVDVDDLVQVILSWGDC